ncbi:MAG TPA: DUF167 domain-containing protein [archaeon]|nr:DUF167 domain-containing protein [archaeon]
MQKSHGIEMDLEVVPNSRQFTVTGFNPWTNAVKVKVREKAFKGKANRELVEALEKIFGAKAEIIQGETGRKKKVFLHTRASKPEISEILERFSKAHKP